MKVVVNVVILVGLCFIGYVLLSIFSKWERTRRERERRKQFLREFRPSEYPDDSYLRPRGEGLVDWRDKV